ncbi:unnamed protein product [Enterobius vermicularis]|uniref:Uncharacterized protein n=1 Tax=Enterobius vermicularis TaxID=51028 RepID=A0A0N4VHC5_ENTVE|nr:unnamed protein product [Enterobius vermicularis]
MRSRDGSSPKLVSAIVRATLEHPVGFGQKLALRCVQEGLTTFAACLTKEGVKNLSEQSRFCPGTLFGFQMNVSNEKSVEEGRKFVENRLRSSNLDLNLDGSGRPSRRRVAERRRRRRKNKIFPNTWSVADNYYQEDKLHMKEEAWTALEPESKKISKRKKSRC